MTFILAPVFLLTILFLGPWSSLHLLLEERLHQPICTDHSSGLLFVQHQVGFTVLETLEAKMAFESWSYNSGVLICKYTTDNGSLFGASDFVDVIQIKGQIV